MAEPMTPSERIVAAANTPGTVMDASGREIVVRLVRGSERSRFARLCGTAGDTVAWFNEALVRACVVSVDGLPIPIPRTLAQVDGLFDLVDETATAAAETWLLTSLSQTSALADAKNSGGTPNSTNNSGS